MENTFDYLTDRYYLPVQFSLYPSLFRQENVFRPQSYPAKTTTRWRFASPGKKKQYSRFLSVPFPENDLHAHLSMYNKWKGPYLFRLPPNKEKYHDT